MKILLFAKVRIVLILWVAILNSTVQSGKYYRNFGINMINNSAFALWSFHKVLKAWEIKFRGLNKQQLSVEIQT